MKPMYLFLLLFSLSPPAYNGARAALHRPRQRLHLLAGCQPDLSISQFRENFNRQNPDLPLRMNFRAIENSRDKVT